MIEQFVKKYNLINEGDTITVALSGGADSVCLLHSLLQLKETYKLSIKAIHINHMIRQAEAKRDSDFCVALCKKYQVPIKVMIIDVPSYKKEHKITLEQAGREVRFSEFKKIEGKVALGHHRDDQVETVLMNIIRGCSSTGLKGISEVNGNYIRPLLETSKKQIIAYCEKHHLDYVTDSTNLMDEYFRNGIRNRVLPLLDEITAKDVSENIIRLSKLVGEEADYIEKITTEKYKEIVVEKNNKCLINNADIIKEDKVISRRIIRQAILKVKGNLTDVEYTHTEEVLNLCYLNITGKRINLTDGISALVQFGFTYIYEEEEKSFIEYELKIPGKTIIAEKNIVIKTSLSDSYKIGKPSGVIHYFSFDAIKKPISVRNKIDGDFINPYKGNGRKKLKKYFIDKKIDRFERNQLLLIAEGSNILYINGYEYSKDFMPSNDNRVLVVEIVERQEHERRY